MCGIVGITAKRKVIKPIVDGLQTLEYRGYDSAGVAVLSDKGLELVKRAGKLEQLKEQLAKQPIDGNCGIGHTRWATHGMPNTENAHPHQSQQKIAVVHNGIIENHQVIREQLERSGYRFLSETDTETIVHLIHSYKAQGDDFKTAAFRAINQLEGAYALAIIDADEPGKIIAARKGSPLVVGVGEQENFIASDVQALIKQTKQFYYLEEGDMVEITTDSCQIYDKKQQLVERSLKTVEMTADSLSKGGYAHYMLKEIHEQPNAVAQTLKNRLLGEQISEQFISSRVSKLLKQAEQIHIVACGTSFHAGMVARYWLESLTGVPTQVEIASEYRYRNPVVGKNSLFLTISQSGETADSLAALRFANQAGYLASIAVCNVANSTLDRESDHCLLTCAGPEIGVASTKALTTQLTVLAMLTLKTMELKGKNQHKQRQLAKQLQALPGTINQALLLNPAIKKIAKKIAQHNSALFLGRGVHYPIALEGALKLKEISYIHAEGYPAGELKHGPLALVDEKMPVIAVCPNDELLEKLKSNIEEVRARGGKLYVFVDHKSSHDLDKKVKQLVALEAGGEFTSPIVFNLPLQLLAYHVALIRGTDVDQPRNLAKSVTVE